MTQNFLREMKCALYWWIGLSLFDWGLCVLMSGNINNVTFQFDGVLSEVHVDHTYDPVNFLFFTAWILALCHVPKPRDRLPQLVSCIFGYALLFATLAGGYFETFRVGCCFESIATALFSNVVVLVGLFVVRTCIHFFPYNL